MWPTFLCGIILLEAVVTASLYDGTANKELEKFKYRNQLLHDLLIAENCPDPGTTARVKREVMGKDEVRGKTKLEVEMKFYEDLTTMLIECRKGNFRTRPTVVRPVSATEHSTIKPSTTTATEKVSDMPTTALQSGHTQECERAINLTEAWRQDHNGSNIEADEGFPVCDPKQMEQAGFPWFRFTGEAGNRLLDHCVPYDSCGTNFPLWSDDRMPTSVGVPMTFKVYSSVADDCRHEAFAASVIRCSNKPADFVYRWEVNTKDKFDCFYGFCGMTA